MKNSIEEDMKILEGIIKGDEDCINAIYSQMKVKNDNDEDIQYYKKEIQSIKNIVDNYLKEKARADKLEKEYSAMLTESDENECDYKRVLKENEQLSTEVNSLKKENEELKFKERSRIIGKYGDVEIHDVINRTLSNDYIPIQKAKDKIEELEEELEIMKVDNMYGRYKEYGGKTKWERLFATKYGMHDVLQELLEGRK